MPVLNLMNGPKPGRGARRVKTLPSEDEVRPLAAPDARRRSRHTDGYRTELWCRYGRYDTLCGLAPQGHHKPSSPTTKWPYLA